MVVAFTGVLPNPNVGTDVLGVFAPKANGVEMLALVDVFVIDGTVEVVVFAVAPNLNMDGVLVPSMGFATEGIDVVGVPNEIFALVVNADGFDAGLPKLNVTGAVVV